MERARYEKLHYMNLGTEAAPKYELINEGITDFTESQNAQSDTRQYIGEKTASQRVRSLQPSFAYAGLLNDEDLVSKKLYEIGSNQEMNVKVKIVHVDTWGPDKTKLVARKGVYAVIPENPGSGSGGEDLGISGTLSQTGEIEIGTWDMGKKTFTANKGN
jgi:hypothetical protein